MRVRLKGKAYVMPRPYPLGHRSRVTQTFAFGDVCLAQGLVIIHQSHTYEQQPTTRRDLCIYLTIRATPENIAGVITRPVVRSLMGIEQLQHLEHTSDRPPCAEKLSLHCMSYRSGRYIRDRGPITIFCW